MVSKYNVLHINTFPDGGAANAAIRLHNALLKKGINSSFLTIGNKKDIAQLHSYVDISRIGWFKNPFKKYRAKKDYFRKKQILQNKLFTPELFSFSDSYARLEQT
jgi:hypothetical protein